MELLGREEREGWVSVRSGGSTARDITQRAVIVMFFIVVTMETENGLTNFQPQMTNISHVAKEEQVSYNFYSPTIMLFIQGNPGNPGSNGVNGVSGNSGDPGSPGDDGENGLPG